MCESTVKRASHKARAQLKTKRGRLTFQYPSWVLTPTAWTQWSTVVPQVESVPETYVDHVEASRQTDRGPVVIT